MIENHLAPSLADLESSTSKLAEVRMRRRRASAVLRLNTDRIERRMLIFEMMSGKWFGQCVDDFEV